MALTCLFHLAGCNLEKSRTVTEAFEHRLIGAGHPGLAADRVDQVKQGGAAMLVKVEEAG